MSLDPLEQAYAQAMTVLTACCSTTGFKASADQDGYNEIWARDSMMTILAAVLVDQPTLTSATYASLRTLAKFQTELGLIPNNVDVAAKQADYHAYMDGNMWYIIAAHAVVQQTQDQALLHELYPSVVQTLQWLAYQDVDQSGLLSIQEAGDWQDHFPIRGKTLYDNTLYYRALLMGAELAAQMGNQTQQQHYQTAAQTVHQMIQHWFWTYQSQATMASDLQQIEQHSSNPVSAEYEKIAVAENNLDIAGYPYLLAFRSYHQAGSWFDTLGNMLAICFGITTAEQTEHILNYAAAVGIATPYPAQAIYPVIEPGDVAWKEYLRKGALNLPHQYHNGGIWPFIGGWYVLALMQAKRLEPAQQALAKLAQANALGNKSPWEFNEWLHGVSGQPMGKAHQAWSAAMYIKAYRAVIEA